jgi:hypothetical protein
MATVRILPADVESWIGARASAPRSEGHHVSRLVLGMLQAIHQRKYGEWGKGGDREPQYEPGYIWEDLLSAALAKNPAATLGEEFLGTQIEITAGGIFGTPDRLSWSRSARRIIVDECKATWYSFRKLEVKDPKRTPEAKDGERIVDEPTFAYWILQAKTYAAMLWAARYTVACHGDVGHRWTGLVREDVFIEYPGIEEYAFTVESQLAPPLVRVAALFLNGSYRGDRARPFRCEIEWSAAELEAWWQNVQSFAAGLPPIGADDNGQGKPTDV